MKLCGETQQSLFGLKEDNATACEDWLYLKQKKIFLCPVCGEELICDGKLRLETQNEHVLDPNGEPALKFNFICQNKFCLSSHMGFHWSSEGGLYTSRVYIDNQINFIDGISSAINSFDWEMDKKKKYEESRTFHLKLGRYELWCLLHMEFFIPNNPIYWSITLWWKGTWRWDFSVANIKWRIKRLLKKKRGGA